jgi:hypothetical protein
MNADQQATDTLAAQEVESLAGCVGRGQHPDSYADIIAKIRGHVLKLPADRQAWWNEQCATLGVVLIPKSVEKRAKAQKDE